MPALSDHINVSNGPHLLRDAVHETGAVTVRLLAYFSGLAMLALIATDLLDQSPRVPPQQRPLAVNWVAASRPHPAFAVSAPDFQNRTEAYEILRHPDGGRKDIIRWLPEADAKPVAEIEILRPGEETATLDAPEQALANRLTPVTVSEAEPAGMIETKFGRVGLWGFPGGMPNCLGFAKDFETPRLRISGWSCQADSRAAQRALIACALDRLVLLSAGNDPRIAALFAHAELKRGNCSTRPAMSADWVSAAAVPQLRGRL